jgi:hypothetical protein
MLKSIFAVAFVAAVVCVGASAPAYAGGKGDGWGDWGDWPSTHRRGAFVTEQWQERERGWSDTQSFRTHGGWGTRHEWGRELRGRRVIHKWVPYGKPPTK